MCIYCGTKRYTKIYENHFGPIPKEEDGRSYEVHHLDGDHGNNLPENLRCLTLQDHYNIHHSQGDYGACFLMAQKMRYSQDIIAELNRKQNQKRIAEGTHNLSRRADGGSNSKDRVINGTHPFLAKNRTSLNCRKQKLHNWKNPNTSEIERLSSKDLCAKYDLNQGNISSLVNGRAKSVKGWIIGI